VTGIFTEFFTWALGLAALAAAYLLFAGQVSPGEALAAGPAVAAGFGLAVLNRRHAQHALRGTAADFAPLTKLPGALAVDTVRVAAALLRSLVRPRTGVFLSRPLRANRPAETGLAVLAQSLAPNGFVADLGDEALVLHRLVP